MENSDSQKNVWVTLSSLNIVLTSLCSVLDPAQKAAMRAALAAQLDGLKNLKDLSVDNFLSVQETIQDVQAYIDLLDRK
ncbi:MAG TPA: hypothetical protein VGN04_11515 [Herbaspirillum sp.]|jgi:hypothetical protein